jgi:hypothetical protein
MSGRSGSDDEIIRHQQEKDLGHEIEKPGGADKVRASYTGSGKVGGEATGRGPGETGMDDRRRKKSP